MDQEQDNSAHGHRLVGQVSSTLALSLGKCSLPAKQAPAVHFRPTRDDLRHATFARVDYERSRELLLDRSHFAALGGAGRSPNLAIDVLANKSDAAVAADHVDPTGVKAAG